MVPLLAFLLLTATSLPVADAGGLLGGLADKITRGRSPEELAKTIKEKAGQVAKQTPADLAGSIRGAINASSVVEEGGAAEKQAGAALQKSLGAAPAVPQPAQIPQIPQMPQDLSKALSSAGKALHYHAREVGGHHVDKFLHKVIPGGVKTPMSLARRAEVMERIIKSGRLSPEKVAILTKKLAKVKELMHGGGNDSTATFADIVRAKIPQVMGMLDQTGDVVQERLSNGIEKVTGRKPTATEVRGIGFGGAFLWVFVFCGVAAMGFKVFFMPKPSARGLRLLTDPISTGGAGSETAGIQLPDSESTGFVNF